MFKFIPAALVAVILLLAFSSPAAAQGYPDTKKKEEPKTMMKSEGLKTVSCDPTCGFSVTSHDEKEIMAMVKDHAKKQHNKEMTDAEVKGMMKSSAGMKKTEAPPH